MVKIAFDLDGVVADFTAAARPIIRELFVPNLPDTYEPTRFDYGDVLQPGQWPEVFKRMIARPSLWLDDVPDYPASVAAIRDYINVHGEDGVYFLTSRPDCGQSAKTLTSLWLWDRKLPMHNLHVTPLVGGAEAKAEICFAHGIHFFLDDLAKNVAAVQAAGTKAFLYDAPYNQDVDLPRKFSVAEFLLEAEFHETN